MNSPTHSIRDQPALDVIRGGAFGPIAVALTEIVWQRIMRKGPSPV